MIVTIDGPAGSGKSTAAKGLARRLGYDFLDTGAMYRAIALACLRGDIPPADEARLVALLETLTLEMPPGRVVLDGEDVAGLIRTAEVTRLVTPVADSPAVRRRLTAMQRRIAAGRDFVTEGRDQGTLVFPDAGCKFFLVADEQERARRRVRQMATQGETADLDAVLEAIRYRDARDAARDLAPMVPADDAVRLDTTGLTVDEVVDRMEATVRGRLPAA